MKLAYIFALLSTTFFAQAQSNNVKINPGIVLPNDSIESKNLMHSLNGFLSAAQKSNKENNFVLESEKIETFILLDKINGIEKSSKANDVFFYKPYLTNVVSLNDNSYLIQLSYIGTFENGVFLRGNFEFIAHKINDAFVFSSPLLKNTKHWKVLKVGNHIFHYQNSINKEKVEQFARLTNAIDAKLKVPNKITDYYLCDNVVSLNKLIGVDYKADYNGVKESYSTITYGERKLFILGNGNSSFETAFDLHDLFHDRLSLVIDRGKVNKPVDEGCAYLYGGSWGFTWKEIFKAFKEQVASNKGADWAAIKERDVRFKTGNFTNSTDNVVNALLVQKIEKEKGFAGVWELLNVGPVEKGNEKYYQMLEKLTGITKANYNAEVWKLINKEK